MFKRIRVSDKFLYYLTELRKRATDYRDFEYPKKFFGVPGFLLADKKGKHCGCYLFTPAHCSPKPFISGWSLAESAHKVHEAGLTHAGLVVLNLDTLRKGTGLAYVGAYVGANVPGEVGLKSARQYGAGYVYRVLDGFFKKMFMIIDEENKPLHVVKKGLYDKAEFKVVRPSSRAGKDSRMQFFVDSKDIEDILRDIVTEDKDRGEVVINGKVVD